MLIKRQAILDMQKILAKKVSKLYKITPGTKIPGVKISAIKDIIGFVYIKKLHINNFMKQRHGIKL